MAADEPTPVLDYASPRIPRRTRQLSDFTVALCAWVTACVFYIWVSYRLGRHGSVPVAAPFLLITPFLLIAIIAVAHMAWAKQRNKLLILVLLIAVTAPFAGLVQLEQCPHATYLQVFGVSIPISGRACGNQRDVTPWWMRL